MEKFFLGRFGRAIIIVLFFVLGFVQAHAMLTNPVELESARQTTKALKDIPLVGGILNLPVLVYPLVCLVPVLVGLRMRKHLYSVTLIAGGNGLFSQVLGYGLAGSVLLYVLTPDLWSLARILIVALVIAGFLYWRVDTRPLFLIPKKTAS